MHFRGSLGEGFSQVADSEIPPTQAVSSDEEF